MRLALAIRSASLLLEAGFRPGTHGNADPRPILVKTFAFAPIGLFLLALNIVPFAMSRHGKEPPCIFSNLRLRADGLWSPALWRKLEI